MVFCGLISRFSVFFLRLGMVSFKPFLEKGGPAAPRQKDSEKKRPFKTETHHYWPAFFFQSLTGLKQYSSPRNLDSQSVA